MGFGQGLPKCQAPELPDCSRAPGLPGGHSSWSISKQSRTQFLGSSAATFLASPCFSLRTKVPRVHTRIGAKPGAVATGLSAPGMSLGLGDCPSST